MSSPISPLLATLSMAIALAVSIGAPTAQARDRPSPHEARAVFDYRYGHNHYYPPRGQAVFVLPREARESHWHGTTYYFHNGVWYRPARSRWIVVTPPIGLVVAALPPFYTTVWLGGAPYYYANDVYYAWRPAVRSYVVVEPPVRDADGTPAAASQIYVYPQHGQSAEQQATDRYECHRWAVNETGFDPTQPAGGVAADQSATKRDGYARAITACLQGRGYSVK